GKSLARAERALAYIKDRDVADESTIRAEFATYFDAVA
ncbi:MAG: beta-hexosaminidase, partial [Mesorhizobium sp.]